MARAAALDEAAALLDAAAATQENFAVGERAGDKAARVAALVSDALARLTGHDFDGSGVPTAERGRALYVRGRAADLGGGSSDTAEDCLTRAVKLCPESTEAWNALGVHFWRRGQLAHARAAFTSAQSRASNAPSLRHLSGVARGMAQACGNPAERAALSSESVAHAKAALALDVSDGASWYNLAMAQLAHAFAAGGGAADALAPVLKAFAQAERCGEGARNPDLHFNRGVVLRYLEEDLQGAADSFAAAGRMDDSLPWRQQLSDLVDEVSRAHDLVAARGRQKPKRIAAAAAAAAATPPPPGLAAATLATLAPGTNAGVSLSCRVFATASPPGAVPVVHIAVDAAGDCFALSLFGLREGALREGAATVLLAPHLAHARLQAPDRPLAYPLLRVHGAAGVLSGGAHPTAHAEPPQLAARRPAAK